MTTLPIVHMTLYKHGVGYYRRRAKVSGEAVKLSFRREEMDDLLKSLTVIDYGGGHVRGIDYDTPQTKKEKLAGCSIILTDTRSLRDLLLALQGRMVALQTKTGSTETGILVGLDESQDKPQKASLVSLLRTDTNMVSIFPLNTLDGVTLQDETSAGDLRFFLQTTLGQETHRSITVRLNPGEHDLEVNYIAPAPTWRVSYRLILESATEDGNKTDPKALLQGWGIFDNRLEEDLTDISLSLTAGMPISFRYDLYTPHIPERPLVAAEKRVAAGPIEFAPALAEEMMMADEMAAPAAPAPKMAKRSMARAAGGASMAQTSASAPGAATGKALGELFQYNVDAPVTVGRGQSAMVPIVSSAFDVKKDLIYNHRKMPTHPVATIRFNNQTDLTLEHGPVTVLENGEYVGEAVLPFTVNQAEAVAAYAVELGIHIKEDSHRTYQLNSLDIKDAYLLRQEYEILQTTYHLENRTDKPKQVLVEHGLASGYTVFETENPSEKTLDTHRYRIKVESGKLTKFVVKERYLRTRREELRQLSYQSLQAYLKDKYLDNQTYQRLTKLLDAWGEISTLQTKIKAQERGRQQIYATQEQAQKNMKVLTNTGEEGKLRNQYVKQLTDSEKELSNIDQQIKNLKNDINAKQVNIQKMILALSDKK